MSLILSAAVNVGSALTLAYSIHESGFVLITIKMITKNKAIGMAKCQTRYRNDHDSIEHMTLLRKYMCMYGVNFEYMGKQMPITSSGLYPSDVCNPL